jgi:MFS transporter, SHS family, lactate transporter
MHVKRWWHEPTRGQWLCFAAAWGGWVLDAFDFTIFMLVMPDIARDFGVENIATTSSIALTLIARLFGGWLAGAAADRWGRKLPLLVSIAWFALCDGAVALAPTFASILVLRTLFGIGMGGEWTSGTTLAMENWPQRSRGIASGILQGSWAVGYLAAALVSAAVLPAWGWRGLFVIAAIPAALILPLRGWIPESAELDRALRVEEPQSLLEPKILGRLIWGSGAMALGLGAYYALCALYPTMLKTELGAGDEQVAVLVAIFNVGMMIGSVAWGTTAARRGATIAIAVPALASIGTLPLYLGASPALLSLGAFLAGSLGVGFSGVVPLLLTDLVEARVRARFVGLVYHVGALAAAFVPIGIAWLAKLDGMSLALSLGIVAAGCECGLAALVIARGWTVARERTRSRTVLALTSTVLLLLGGCGETETPAIATTASALESVASFGPNPGNLEMLRYVPAGVPSNAPLVVALHGCTQSAEAFADNGLKELADRYKFHLVYPQQQTANNPVTCFDWFGQYNMPSNKANITRGQGENESIKEMVDEMKADYSVDPSRVFVIGFSAGGAMAAVMLAAWPDVFAAGGLDAAIPYDCPSTENADVWLCQNPGRVLDASDWGQRVRDADPTWSGAHPRVSIWQGTIDYIVATANRRELIKQWTNVHGLPDTPTSMDMVDGQPHELYADSAGAVKVESYSITGMDHGFSVDPSHGCGTSGQYLPDKHICTAAHMIEFFGIGSAPPPPPADGGVRFDAGGVGSRDAGDRTESDAGRAPTDAGSNGSADCSCSDAGAMPDAHTTGSAGRRDASGPGAHAAGGDGGSQGGSGAALAGCTAVDTGRPPGKAAPLAIWIALFALALRPRARRR